MEKSHLPPGFRFHPTDVELLKYYLKRKVMGKKLHIKAIAEVDIYKFAPADLPDQSLLRTGDLKWYFFCPRERKYSSGSRMNRAAICGYWKTTGKDRSVLYNNEAVGSIKTLIFHYGKAPRGERTDWVMHEYRLEDKELAQKNVVQDAFVLCVVFKKDGLGPKNGAQYGAPFREEDWSDNEDVDVHEAIPFVNRPIACSCLTQQEFSVAKGLPVPTNRSPVTMSQSSVLDVAPANSMPPPLLDGDNTPVSKEAPPAPIDDISSLLDFFVEDENPVSSSNQIKLHEDVNVALFMDDLIQSDWDDIFSGLEDLGNLDGLNGGLSKTPTENSTFLELQDLAVSLNFPVESQSLANIKNNVSQGFSNVPDQTCFSVDPSSSAATEHSDMPNQLHKQPTESYPDYSIHKRSF